MISAEMIAAIATVAAFVLAFIQWRQSAKAKADREGARLREEAARLREEATNEKIRITNERIADILKILERNDTRFSDIYLRLQEKLDKTDHQRAMDQIDRDVGRVLSRIDAIPGNVVQLIKGGDR